MLDEWSGLADLLANLIEKYAADLDIGDMPNTSIKTENKVEKREKEQKSCIANNTVVRYNNRDNTVQTKAKNMKKGKGEYIWIIKR